MSALHGASATAHASIAARRLRVSFAFTLCTLLSLVSDMLTKHMLQQHARQGLAMTITFFHFAVSALCGFVTVPAVVYVSQRHVVEPSKAACYGPSRQLPPSATLSLGIPRSLARTMVLLALCQVGGFLTTNLSLKFVPVSFSHTVKACECLFTAALAFFVLGQRLNGLAYTALVPTAAGVALSATSELHFSARG